VGGAVVEDDAAEGDVVGDDAAVAAGVDVVDDEDVDSELDAVVAAVVRPSA
jgi:hypothetical protein